MSLLLLLLVAALAAPLLLWALAFEVLPLCWLCQPSDALYWTSWLTHLLPPIPGVDILRAFACCLERVATREMMAAGSRLVGEARRACPLVPEKAVEASAQQEVLKGLLHGIEKMDDPCSVHAGLPPECRQLLEWLRLRAASLYMAMGDKQRGREHYCHARNLAGPSAAREGGDWKEELELLRGAVAADLLLANEASPALRYWAERDFLQLVSLAARDTQARKYMQSRKELWKLQRAAETPLNLCAGKACGVPEESKICAGTLGIQLTPLSPAKASAAP